MCRSVFEKCSYQIEVEIFTAAASLFWFLLPYPLLRFCVHPAGTIGEAARTCNRKHNNLFERQHCIAFCGLRAINVIFYVFHHVSTTGIQIAPLWTQGICKERNAVVYSEVGPTPSKCYHKGKGNRQCLCPVKGVFHRIPVKNIFFCSESLSCDGELILIYETDIFAVFYGVRAVNKFDCRFVIK